MARAATNETPPMTLPSSVGTQQSRRHYGGSGSRSLPYQLLLKTDTTYVVQSQANGEGAIEFRQDVVKGMIMLQQQ